MAVAVAVAAIDQELSLYGLINMVVLIRIKKDKNVRKKALFERSSLIFTSEGLHAPKGRSRVPGKRDSERRKLGKIRSPFTR